MIVEGVEDKLCVLEGVILEVRDEIKGKFNIDKEEWREVQKQILELKKDTEIIKRQIEDSKKGNGDLSRNIVIFGWRSEENENIFDTYNRVRELLAKVLKIDINNIKIDNINWIGKSKKNRPMIIKFTNSMIKEYILERKGWFKGCKLRVEQDYNEEVCKTRRKLVEFMFEARRRGEHAVLIKDKVQISGVQWNLEECRRKFKKGEENNEEREKVKGRTIEEGKQENVIKVERSKEKRNGIREIIDKGAVESHKVRKDDKEEEEIKTDEKMIVIEEANIGPAEGVKIKELSEHTEVNPGTSDKETWAEMKWIIKENCKKISEEMRDAICEIVELTEKKNEERYEERGGDREEKMEGEIRMKIKENGRNIFGIEEQHKRSNERKLEGKQTKKKDVIKTRKDKCEENSSANIDGNWKISYYSNTGYKDYCNENDGMWSQRNMSHGRLLKTNSMLSIQDGKWSRPKDTSHTWSKRDSETRYF